jgi:hypothetical protein
MIQKKGTKQFPEVMSTDAGPGHPAPDAESGAGQADLRRHVGREEAHVRAPPEGSALPCLARPGIARLHLAWPGHASPCPGRGITNVRIHGIVCTYLG